MYVSHETPAQTDRRLRSVIARARLDVFDGAFRFVEFPGVDFPQRASLDALALVRDRDGWSQLVEAPSPGDEQFAVFCFHFDPALDNSGFVGWLATHLKHRLGTGVFVICGWNARQGGIFDYWGCPFNLKDAVLNEITALAAKAGGAPGTPP